MKSHKFSLLIILLFSFIGMKALFHEGLFSAHDIWHQVARLHWYFESVKVGVVFPHWIAPLAKGYGYPLFLFSYHLPWIVALPFLFLHFSIASTLKILFFLSFFLSGVGMYLLLFSITKKKWPALVSALLYLFVPYHFLVILVSASIGKSFVFVFVPIVTLGVYLLGKRYIGKSGVVLVSASVFALVLTHLMSLFALIPLGLFVLTLKPRLKLLVPTALLGVGISSFYLLPALLYSPQTQVSSGIFKSLYLNNFLSFDQLLYSRWGYGIVNESAKTAALSFQLGMAQWITIGLALLYIVGMVIRRRPFARFLLPTSLLVSTSISIFMMLDYSKPVWAFISRFITLDYPFMFLMPAVFATSVLAGVLVARAKHWGRLFGVLFVLLALVNNRNHLRVNMYTDIPEQVYIDSETTTNSFHEYLPKEADIKLLSEEKYHPILPATTVSDFSQTIVSTSFRFTAERGGEVSFGHFAFPGVSLYIDDKRVLYETNSDGLISTEVEKGEHSVIIRYEETALMLLAKALSVFSLAALSVLLLRLKGRRRSDIKG